MVNAGTASNDIYSADYSVDPTEAIIKLTLYADFNNVPASEAGVNSIAGVELDFTMDWTQFEAIEYTDSSFNRTEEVKSAITTNHLWEIYDIDGKVGTVGGVENISDGMVKLIATSIDTAANPPKTFVDGVATIGMGETDRPETLELGSIYLNPLDTLTEVSFSYGSATSIVVTNAATDNYVQDVISMNVDIV
jgi:hypothetical protein